MALKKWMLPWLLALCACFAFSCHSKQVLDDRGRPVPQDIQRFGAVAASSGYGIVWITPIDGASDDSPRLHSIELANMYRNAIGLLPCTSPSCSSSHWKILSSLYTPSGTVIIGTPGTIIDATYAGGGIQTGLFSLIGQQGGSHIALSANNTPGTNQLSVASSVSPGTIVLALNNTTGLLGSIYKVTAVSGSGPFTITLDEPVPYTFTTAGGDYVQPLNTNVPEFPSGAAQDVRVFGNGMVANMNVTGGSISVENLCAQYNELHDITFNMFANNANAVTEDTGSRHNIVDNVRVYIQPGVTGTQGIWVQGNYHVVQNSLVVGACADPCMGVISAVGSVIRDSKVIGSTTGDAFLSTNDGNPTTYAQVGFNNVFEGDVSFSNGTGYSIANGENTSVVGCQSINDNVGFSVAGSAVAPRPLPRGTLIKGCIAKDSSGYGLYVQAGTIGLDVDGLETTGAVQDGINWGGQANIRGHVQRNISGTQTGVIVQAAATGTYSGFELEQTQNTATVFTVSGDVRISGGVINLDGNNFAASQLNNGSKTYLERVKITGTNPTSCIPWTVNGGAKLYLGPGNDFDAATLIFSVQSGGYVATVQDRGLKSVSTTGGTTFLNLADSQTSVIETTGALSSNATIEVLGGIEQIGGNAVGFQGMVYSLLNNNTGGSTTTFVGPSGTGFAVAQGKRAVGYVDGSGNMKRVSPDTGLSPALRRRILRGSRPANDVTPEAQAA